MNIHFEGTFEEMEIASDFFNHKFSMCSNAIDWVQPKNRQTDIYYLDVTIMSCLSKGYKSSKYYNGEFNGFYINYLAMISDFHENLMCRVNGGKKDE